MFNMSIVSFYPYLLPSKNAKIEEEKVGSGLTCLMFRQKAMHSILNSAKIPLILLGIGSSKIV